MTTRNLAPLPPDAAGKAAWIIDVAVRQHALFELIESLGVGFDQNPEALARRQSAITELDTLAHAARPVIDNWASIEPELPPCERARIADITARTEQLRAAISERDTAERHRLESERAALRRELASLTKNKSAVTGYAGSDRRAPRFQDREA